MNTNRILNLRFKDLEVFLEEVAVIENQGRAHLEGVVDDPEDSDSPRVKRAQVRKRIEEALAATTAAGTETDPLPEDAASRSLFVGKGRRRRLSERGKLAKEFSEQLLECMRRFAQQASLSQGQWGGIRIAYRAMLWSSLIKNWVHDWSLRAPYVPIQVRGERAQTLDDHLVMVDPDLSVQFNPPPPGPYAPILLWTENLVFVANNTGLEQPLRVRSEQDLGGSYVHVDRGDRLNSHISRAFAHAPNVTNPRFTFTIQSDAMDFLCATPGAAGYFSSWLVRERMEQSGRSGRALDLKILDGPAIPRPVYLVHRKRFGNPLQPEIESETLKLDGRPVDEEAFSALVAMSREALPPGVSPDALNRELARAMIRDVCERAKRMGRSME